MKTIKFIAIFIAGLSVAVFTTYAAEPGVSIFANINSFTQYIQNFFVTSDGTPTGEINFSIDQDGKLYQKYETLIGDPSKGLENGQFTFGNEETDLGDDLIAPALQGKIVGIDSYSTFGLSAFEADATVGFLSTYGVNENHTDIATVQTLPEGVYISKKIQNSNGYETAASINVGGSYSDEDGVRGHIDIFANAITNTQRHMTWSNGLYNNILQLFGDGSLRIADAYTLPITDGQANQVLSTNGQGQLSWTDVSGGGGGGAGVSSLNGQIGDLWLTSDDIEQGEENQFLVTKRITLSAEQILNLHTNPLPALPAPGNNKIITVLDIFARFNPGATAYTPSGFPNVAVYYQDQDPGSALKTNYDFLENTTEFVQKLSPGCFGNCATDMNNKGMFIGYEAGASVSGGDGTVDLYISYKILDLNMPITE